MNPLEMISGVSLLKETVEKAVSVSFLVHDEIVHGGKNSYGEVKVKDKQNRLWKIKIRKTGNRGRYLKCRVIGDSSIKFRASADSYKPTKYIQIEPAEWDIFLCLSQEKNNSDLKDKSENLVNKMIRKKSILERV